MLGYIPSIPSFKGALGRMATGTTDALRTGLIGAQEAALGTGYMLSNVGATSLNVVKQVASGSWYGTKCVIFLPHTLLNHTRRSLVEGVIKETTRSLTEKPHPLLERAYVLLENLRKEIYGSLTEPTEPTLLSIQKTTKNLYDTLTKISDVDKYVFPKGLSLKEKEALNALCDTLTILSDWDGSTPVSLVALEEGFLCLGRHYTPGLLHATLGQTEAVTQRVLGHVAALPMNIVRTALGLPLLEGTEPLQQSPVPTTAATYVKVGLESAVRSGYIENSEKIQKFREVLEHLIKSKSWDEIKIQAQEALSLFQDDGLEPFSLEETEPESLFLPSIQSLGGTSPVPSSANSSAEDLLVSPKTPVDSFETLATREKDLLVDNLASFLTLSYVSEKVCRLKPNQDGYRALLSQHRNDTTKQLLENDLKNAFFLSLKNQSYWTQFKARISYFLLNNIIKYYTKKATTVYFNKILKKIKEGKVDHFESLKASLVKNSHEYLAILNGTYNDVKNSTGIAHPLSKMLADALLANESKLKSNPKELYTAAFADVLKQTLGKRFGAFVGFFLKRFINPEELVLSLIDSASESIKDKRGYSHSLHNIILEQLNEVWESLKSPDSVENPIEAASLSNGKKAELSALITELLEVLGKSKFQTKDELSKSSNGILDTVNHTIDGLAIHNVIESMAVMLSTLTQSILQEDKLQELVFKLMQSTNETFNTQEEITEADKNRVEQAMEFRNKRILNFVIEEAIREKLVNKEDRPGQFITTLRKNSSLFAGELTDLFALYKIEKSQPAFLENILNKIKKETLSYLYQCETALNEIVETNFSEEELNNVMKYYGHAAKQMILVTEAIEEKNLATIEKLIPQLCFSPTAMEKVEDLVAQIAYGRAKERIDALLRLITDPLTLRFGVLHHLFLIPYLEGKR